MMRMVDLSSWNPNIDDWKAYILWSKNGGQTSGIIIRATEGTAFVDGTFAERAREALANGVDEIWYYNNAYPQYNEPQAEVNFLWEAVKNVIRQDRDTLMLDMEQTTQQATPSWSLAWLREAEYKVRKLPVFYSYLAYIQERGYSNYPILGKYPLGLAAYAGTMPAVPSPWTEALWWQNSDHAFVPGISAPVDTDLVESTEEQTLLDISQVSGYFSQNPDGSWKCTNGQEVHGSILDAFKKWPSLGKLNGFSQFGLPLSNEVELRLAVAGKPTPTYQDFERGRIHYDPSREFDNPPGYDGQDCYTAHVLPYPVVASVDTAGIKQLLEEAVTKLG